MRCRPARPPVCCEVDTGALRRLAEAMKAEAKLGFRKAGAWAADDVPGPWKLIARAADELDARRGATIPEDQVSLATMGGLLSAISDAGERQNG